MTNRERASSLTLGRALWVVLALSLLAPPVFAIAWDGIYADAAYEGFQRARAIATGQGWDLGGFSPLYTLLLALASSLHLPLLLVAMALSVAGWMAAIVTWFLTGLTLGRPAFSIAAAALLALHPLQGRVLGLETGLVLGLLGLATWLITRGRAVAALVAVLVLAAAQPLALLFILPLFVSVRLRTPSVPTHWSFLVGVASYGLACALVGSWDEPRLTAPLLAALDLLVAAGFALLVPRFDRLALPAADKRVFKGILLVLGLVALVFWQGSVLVQDWQFRPTDRLALYEALGQWLRDHTLPTETVAAKDAGLLGYLSDRTSLSLPDTGQAQELILAIDRERPDYCIALNSLAWQDVQAQPWFLEHYKEVYQLASPYDAATPLTVFRYAPTPFDRGEVISTTVVFASDAGERIELTGYRLDSQRIIPGEPLHLTLYWHAVTTIRQPLLLAVRLIDPATDEVWTQVENPTPGGLASDLWSAGTLLEDRYSLVPPAGIPPGDYVLDIAFYLPSGRPLLVRADKQHPMGGKMVGPSLVLTKTNHPPNVSVLPLTPDHPLNVTFGSEIELVGYDVPERVAPGETLRVALYWHALQPVSLEYKVFVHLLGPGDQPLAQDDTEPVSWTYPTTRWQPGETIRDEHLLTIPSSAPRGDYWLDVGLYDSATGERPVVYDAAGNEITDRRVILQQIQVR